MTLKVVTRICYPCQLIVVILDVFELRLSVLYLTRLFSFYLLKIPRIISCWQQISYFSLVRVGTIPEMPAESCQEIKASEGEYAVDGMYWLYFLDIVKTVLAYCDMKTGGK